MVTREDSRNLAHFTWNDPAIYVRWAFVNIILSRKNSYSFTLNSEHNNWRRGLKHRYMQIRSMMEREAQRGTKL